MAKAARPRVTTISNMAHSFLVSKGKGSAQLCQITAQQHIFVHFLESEKKRIFVKFYNQP